MIETNYLLIGLVIAVVWFGRQILDRLPKPSGHKDFKYESCDYFVHFRIDALTEKDFGVSFIDGWNTGREFMLYGPLAGDPDKRRFGGLEPKGRLGVNIYPTAHWFKQSRIGYLRSFQSGGIECHVSLPYQIARHVLEDVRREPDQLVSIGFGKIEKDGKTTYPIYSFELSEPLN